MAAAAAARAAAVAAATPACVELTTKLQSVGAKVHLDALLADIKTKPAIYGLCNDDLVQLARIRVGQNELLSLERSVDKATNETDLANIKTLAETELTQVEDGYVLLVGDAPGTSVSLNCIDVDEKSHATLTLEAAPLAQQKHLAPDSVAHAQRQVCVARTTAESVKYTARWRRLAASNLCGGFDPDGQPTPFCVTYGVFAAAISGVAFLGEDLHGITGGRLVSVLVPYAGIRWVPNKKIPFLAVDLSLYSAYITSGTVDSTPKSKPCGGGGTALLEKLPCESEPDIQPYAAGLVGLTFGKENIGYLTVAPLTVGVARVGSQGAHWYMGWLVGTLQLTGRF